MKQAALALGDLHVFEGHAIPAPRLLKKVLPSRARQQAVAVLLPQSAKRIYSTEATR